MGEWKRAFGCLFACALLAGCPEIVITSPVHGAFTSAGTVLVTGTIDDVNIAAASVDVNGVAATINPDGTWSATVPVDPAAVFNPIDATLLEGSNYDTKRVVVVAGDSVAETEFATQSMAMRLSDSGLDSIAPVVSDLVDLDLASLVPVGTVLIDNKCFVRVLTCLGRATVSIDNPPPSISDFDIAFDPATNTVDADITLYDMQIDVDIDGSGVVPNCGLRLTADQTTISGTYTLSPDGAEPTRVDVAQQGNISTAFVSFDEDYTSGACDLPIIGDIIQLFIPDVEDLARDGISNFLNDVNGEGNTPIAAAIESALAGVDISGPISSALGADMNAPFFSIAEDDQGVTLGVDSQFVTNCAPPAGAPDLSRSYLVDEPFPSFDPTTPVNGLPYGLGLCISTSSMNQLLRSQTECGLLLTSVTEISLGGAPIPLTAGVLSLLIPDFSRIDPLIPMRLDLQPTLAPVMTGAPGPGGELAALKIGHLIVRAVTDDGNNIPLLTVALDMDVGVDLTVDPVAGTLAFTLSPPDASAISVHVINKGVVSNPATIEAILPPLVAAFLPELASSLASFPIPSFLGLGLDVVETSRNGQFLSIFSNLN